MAIIVAGRIYLQSGPRATFLTRSMDAIKQARVTQGCTDFAVSADPLEDNRVNIFEQWSDRTSLATFRNTGPDDNLASLIESIDINEYEVDP